MAGLTNKDIARVFREIEILLGVLGDAPKRAIMYGRTSRLIEGLPEPAADLAAAGKLSDVRGVGAATQTAVAEILATGTCSVRDELAARLAPGVLDILRVPGLGPKKVHTVVHELGVNSLTELEAAALDGRLAALKGFGPKSATKALEGIAHVREMRGLFRLNQSYAIAADLGLDLGLNLCEVAGPARRGVPISRGVRVVGVRGVAVGAPEVRQEEHVRIRIVEEASYVQALFEETGPDEHVAAVLARPGTFGSEEEIYTSRGLHYVPPEQRHVCDGTTPPPKLVELADIRGVVHTHTTWSDGALEIADMADAAHARGYSYLVISDHSRVAAYAGGLSIERLREQGEAIRAFNETAGHPVRLFRSNEVDILPDGSMDYPDDVLAELDLVIASVHSSFSQPEEQMTARIVSAARNPHVHILGHVTGRLLGRRNGYAVDVGKVLEAAAESGTCVELNASPWRLDLDTEWHARAVELGIGVPINPDAHSAEGMDDIEWGVRAAQHGGLTAADVPNTLEADAFLARVRG